jgi:hypothetical protein
MIHLFGKAIATKTLIIAIAAGIVVVGAVSGGTYYAMTRNNKPEKKEQKVEKKEPKVEVKTKVCQSSKIKIKMNVPETWTCEEEKADSSAVASNIGTLLIKSDLYDVTLSNMNVYRSDLTQYESASFYTGKLFSLQMLKLKGEKSHVYGEIKSIDPLVYVKIIYKDIANKDLTIEQKSELIKVLDSIEAVINSSTSSTSTSSTTTTKTTPSKSTATPSKSTPASVIKYKSDGFEQSTTKDISATQHQYTYAKYVVTATDQSDSPNQIINVKDPSSGKTVFTLNAPDQADSFFGIYGSYIFIDNGTSAADRTLKIYSLATQKLMYQGGYNSENMTIANGQIRFYRPSYEKPQGSSVTCDTDTLNGYLSEIIVSLSTFKEQVAANIKCTYLE